MQPIVHIRQKETGKAPGIARAGRVFRTRQLFGRDRHQAGWALRFRRNKIESRDFDVWSRVLPKTVVEVNAIAVPGGGDIRTGPNCGRPAGGLLERREPPVAHVTPINNRHFHPLSVGVVDAIRADFRSLCFVPGCGVEEVQAAAALPDRD